MGNPNEATGGGGAPTGVTLAQVQSLINQSDTLKPKGTVNDIAALPAGELGDRYRYTGPDATLPNGDEIRSGDYLQIDVDATPANTPANWSRSSGVGAQDTTALSVTQASNGFGILQPLVKASGACRIPAANEVPMGIVVVRFVLIAV